MKRILFAHSDPKLTQIYKRHFSQHFTVDSAHDGLSALRLLKLNPPLTVISDYNLPLLSGIALLKFVRNDRQLAGIPFIFLTDHQDNSEALSLAANDWINLPSCHPEYLLDRTYHHLKMNKYGLQIN